MSSSDILQQDITILKGVGPKMSERLQKLKLYKIKDLLFHLPLRYQDRTRIYPIGGLQSGQEVLIEGDVEHTEIIFGRRRMMICKLSDGTGILALRFFHFSNAQKIALAKGVRVRCFGEIRRSQYATEMVHPEYRIIKDQSTQVEDELTPVYPTTEGLQQRTLRRLCTEALCHIDTLKDLLPSQLSQQYKLPSLHNALKTLHQPQPDVSVEALQNGKHPAQKRLIFEELMAHHISLLKFKHLAKQQKAPVFDGDNKLLDSFIEQLPFDPTKAQSRVINEIQADVNLPHPMVRLVQGDVGSGKTVVAAAAALLAIEAGYQVALMAPTELLAEQHYQSFKTWFEPHDLEITWISGNQRAKERRRNVENLLLGISNIAIGTHALFQDDIQFQQLGLIIIDEQHRFGVQQRLTLREKGYQGGQYPHQLIMTATPIPRTLAMTAYADLDYSIIDELPPSRQAITTVALPNTRRPDVIERIRNACLQDRQAYWVCTLIEESEVLQCQAAEDTWKLLQESLPELQIGLVHGRMASDEKESIMAAFKANQLHLLVATTVIEVGVDVPNASMMVIENAERLGLAQLHQLRGRVGRGTEASSCVLMYQSPLSKTGRKRIDALRKTTDGFEIAQIDLELRGPGEVLGTKQTGDMQLRIADLMRDKMLLPEVQQAADTLIRNHPEKVEPLIDRWMRDRESYGSV